MNKLCLLLLFCISLFKANPQAGNLDSTFGKNGIQATALIKNANILDEQAHVVLTDANGNIFVVARTILNPWYTRIVKYLPEGKIDSSYGNAGYSNAANVIVTSAVIQGDKIVVAGSIFNESNGNDFGLARFNPDGLLDASFGVNGVATTTFDNADSYANAIALQGNKIILAGYIYNFFDGSNDIALARYSADGLLDSSFGKQGKITTDFNVSDDRANSIVLQGDRIVVAGYTYKFGDVTNDFALVRYTVDGALDSSFGKNGLVKTAFNNLWSYANSAALQGNKIILAGYTYDPFVGVYDFALARYTTNGKLDSSFGENGKVTTDFNDFYDYINSIALQGDKIIAAGYTHSEFALARYAADGVLDSSFGENGLVLTDFKGFDDQAMSVAIREDKIIAAGYTGYSPRDFAVARYKADGSLDASFGRKGKVTGHFPATRLFFTSAATQGEKVIAAGYNELNYFRNDFALARYTHDGAPDPSFGVNGIVTTNFHKSDQKASVLALQGNNIIVGGYMGDDFNGFDFVLACYTTDGVLDSSFGKNGRVTTDFTNNFDRSNSIVVQGDKVLVAGSKFNPDNSTFDFVLLRYTANGRLDSSFGVNGKTTTDFNNSDERANSIVLQGDKIIVGGYTGDIFFSQDFALARYTGDGKLDTSFGQNGTVTTDFDNADDQVTAIELQGDKIIVKGNTGDIFDGFNIILARYTAGGALDASFGENGKVSTGFTSSYNRPSSIALQEYDIIVAGQTGDNDFSFARYTANGKPDSSFGKNGTTTTSLAGTSALGKIVVHENRLYAVGSLTFGQDESYGLIAAYQLESPEPAITIKDITVSESRKVAIATVRLSEPATQRVTVHFITRDKTAIHGQDYFSVRYPLLFIPGANTTAKVFIPIINDNKKEGTEQFEIVLTNARHATIGDSIALVTILDDDAAVIAKQDDALGAEQEAALHINISPNPYTVATTIRIPGGSNKQPLSVRVYDLNGRLIEERKNISIGQAFQFGDRYKAGAYIIEAMQGRQSVRAKVIKSGK